MQSRSLATKAMGAAAIVALLGCGDGGALGESPTVTGQIQGWTLQGATLDLFLMGQTSSQTGISAPVDASGQFSITLPGAAALAAMAGSLAPPDPFMGHDPSACASTIAVSPASVLTTTATFEVSKTVQSGGDTVTTSGDVTLGATAPGGYGLSIVYAYFSEDASASGTLTCNDVSSTVNIDVSKGWNTLRVVTLGDQTDVSSGPPPSAAAWTTELSKDGCASDDDCDLEVCDLSADECNICVVSGNMAESNIDCCNPTALGTGAVVCH